MNGKELVYLDNASTTQKPQCVIDSAVNFYTKSNSNVHRGIYSLSMETTRIYEDIRSKVQKFVNAKHCEEIIFTKGTTESINLVATSLGRVGPQIFQRGDEIILTEMEHHSNIVPWQILAKEKGLKVQFAPINQVGEFDISEFEKMLNPRVKLVAFCHVSNTLGTVNDVQKIVDLAHKNGSLVLVDGAQAMSHLKVDVQEIDADFYVFSAHKMFGPTGVGVLYGKKELLDSLPPYQGGGEMIDMVTVDGFTTNKLPYKFEAGTPNIAGVIGLGVAVDYLENLRLPLTYGRPLNRSTRTVVEYSYSEILEYESKLLQFATIELKKIKGLKIIGEAENKVPVISFVIDGINPTDIAYFLDQKGICIRAGHHCTQPLMQKLGLETGTSRVSFAFYNTMEELSYFIEQLRVCLRILG